MKYTAFGEIRSMNGSSPTDYESKRCFNFNANAFRIRSYTGQRKEVEFGLSYYVARWYDAEPMQNIGLREFASQILKDENLPFSSGHFTSADTLIPQPGSSAAWDRYAYVFNNPLKYTDPSGHLVDTPNDHLPLIDDEWEARRITPRMLKNNITKEVGRRFGWDVSDFRLSQSNLENILDMGNRTSTLIESVDSSINGDKWIKKNLGHTRFIQQQYPLCFGNPCVPGFSTIYLNRSSQYVGTLAHEMGHVLDNGGGSSQFLAVWWGGGYGAELLRDIGITVMSFPRWHNNWGDPLYQSENDTFYSQLNANNALLDDGSRPENTYGNFGLADYFDDARELIIMNKGSVPPTVRTYFEQLIIDLKP